jgi:L-amino acid N-acyltransferase YncA
VHDAAVDASVDVHYLAVVMMTGEHHTTVGLAANDKDLEGILALQRANLEATLADRRNGFVTVVHTLPILRAMHAQLPNVVAHANGHVVAYALAMAREARALLPILEPMFQRLDALLPRERFYVMGQICVAASHRGTGLFDRLYAAHRQHYSAVYDCVVTEVAVRNARSLRAHERVGFTLLERYRDATDDWALLRLRF